MNVHSTRGVVTAKGVESIVYVFGKSDNGFVFWSEKDWAFRRWGTARGRAFLLLLELVKEGEHGFLEALVVCQKSKKVASFVDMAMHFLLKVTHVPSKTIHSGGNEAVLPKEGERGLSILKKVGQKGRHVRLVDQA